MMLSTKRQSGRVAKLQSGKVAKEAAWQNDKEGEWQSGNVTKWQGGKEATRQSGRVAKWPRSTRTRTRTRTGPAARGPGQGGQGSCISCFQKESSCELTIWEGLSGYQTRMLRGTGNPARPLVAQTASPYLYSLLTPESLLFSGFQDNKV